MSNRQLITYQESLNLDSTLYLDVRTPAEFEESTIPGAINIPIFTNEEREQVGTTYTQDSPAQARMLGVELVAPKLPELLKEIKSLTQDYKNTVVFCYRGGLRSESIISFCKLIGLSNIFKLEGGYKSYRHFIMDKLENYSLNGQLLVIHGFTGTGKTELLYKLQEQGLAIIDLEGLANHRGSAFGSIGLGKPTNQKHFDSLLWEKLEELSQAPLIAVEAESKRIGMSVLPEFFLEEMNQGIHILLQRSTEARIEQIYSEYSQSYQQDKSAFIERTLESIKAVKKYIIQKIGKNGYNKLIEHCQQGRLRKVIEILLTKYYDPMYNHSQQQHDDFSLIIQEDNLEKVTEEIMNFTANLSNNQ
ncbi:tRNA 2-selenouridine(34) synthase MnmH [Halanaerobacter jeridensis]|uniref:tRNA 2-selenouridine synthase n=1 Tax=Halanaerobacter jeridensis TaxID=706427 RepID=A0A938XSY4_9FIRM|nr:tRNA 2-selenouridine(34) synthase MnmH [Halanaerobacter jeridensis]MBM7555731.1 tRNA 2-selenouridine synthase [Halanaerobacter jeridensis]